MKNLYNLSKLEFPNIGSDILNQSLIFAVQEFFKKSKILTETCKFKCIEGKVSLGLPNGMILEDIINVKADGFYINNYQVNLNNAIPIIIINDNCCNVEVKFSWFPSDNNCDFDNYFNTIFLKRYQQELLNGIKFFVFNNSSLNYFDPQKANVYYKLFNEGITRAKSQYYYNFSRRRMSLLNDSSSFGV